MVLTASARRRVREIHALSVRCNGSARRPHLRKLLSLLDEHAQEIAVLLKKSDPHGIIETGDLFVLCLEIMLECGKSPDEIVELCLGRYERKLNRLLRERKHGTSARERQRVS